MLARIAYRIITMQTHHRFHIRKDCVVNYSFKLTKSIKGNLGETLDIRSGDSLLSIQKGRYRMQAYCVKCRAKKEMKDAKAITMKNGRPATQGICPTCGTKMFRIGSTK
jgi:PHP family Zn ribbon phosphoesterase